MENKRSGCPRDNIALVLLILFLGISIVYAAGKFEPPDGKTLLLIGQNQESMDTYVKEFKTIPAGFMLYTDLEKCTGLSEPFDCGSGTMYGQHLVDNYPGTVIQIGLYMVDMLDDALAGNYDSSIDRLGRWMAAAKRPIFLRIGYEFDGPHNHYDPQKYVRAYRYIVDRLRKNHLENVAFVWHSYASYPVYMSKQQSDYYPGDEYVDWFAVSFFDNSASSVPMSKMLAMAKEHGKPLMLAEATPAHIGVSGGKQAYFRWYRPLFKFIDKNNVKMLCYINTDWDSQPMFADGNWKDSRVQSNSEIRKIWLDEISKDRYLKYSIDLYNLLGMGNK